ncbi:MAG TPA: fibronectin/fibrinogen-binding protein, partial [Erysipelotrichaceae bacterium]|nr:fibronectin/fibrinogen-binding protein [Erysipelotrichaceae bacterium]
MAFDGIVLNAVTKKLKEEIESGRISKLYAISQYELLMVIRAHNKNKKFLVSIHPTYARIQLTNLDYPTPDFPDAMTMLMRKHMEGSFIEKIEQIGLDRIVKMTLRGRNEFKDQVTLYLYIEIMGKHSNFTLTDENNRIIECLKRVSPSESMRFLQPGITYHLPPLIEKKNPFTQDYIPSDNLIKIYEGFSKDLAVEVK